MGNIVIDHQKTRAVLCLDTSVSIFDPEMVYELFYRETVS